ncbi:MAG: hypothetical protein K2P81_02040 [Bacteriovoracaceae bacterium]|nr:hypothetical protein [Bacteriovoracaceae bacterium]
MGFTPKRLYIFTGKGGVGKTTLSLAFTQWLREQNLSATYLTLSQQALSDERASYPTQSLNEWGNIPHIHLELEECAEGYISKKLGSSMLSKWIVKTAFFRALVNMLPGFGYVISVGKVLDMLNEDPQLIIVLDAPASGHALAMLEATSNFREIFQAGLVFDDTEKMLKRLYDEKHTGVRILTLPTSLSMQEAVELKTSVQKLAPLDTKIFLNHSLESWTTELSDAPVAMKEKLSLELEVIEEFKNDLSASIPYSASSSAKEIYQDIKSSLEKFV